MHRRADRAHAGFPLAGARRPPQSPHRDELALQALADGCHRREPISGRAELGGERGGTEREEYLSGRPSGEGQLGADLDDRPELAPRLRRRDAHTSVVIPNVQLRTLAGGSRQPLEDGLCEVT